MCMWIGWHECGGLCENDFGCGWECVWVGAVCACVKVLVCCMC